MYVFIYIYIYIYTCISLCLSFSLSPYLSLSLYIYIYIYIYIDRPCCRCSASSSGRRGRPGRCASRTDPLGLGGALNAEIIVCLIVLFVSINTDLDQAVVLLLSILSGGTSITHVT